MKMLAKGVLDGPEIYCGKKNWHYSISVGV